MKTALENWKTKFIDLVHRKQRIAQEAWRGQNSTAGKY